MLLEFQFGKNGPWEDPRYVAAYLFLVGFLAVSRIPTFSSKGLHRSLIAQPKQRFLFGVCAVVVLAFLFYFPYLLFIGISLGYFASLPVSFRMYRRAVAKEKKETTTSKKVSNKQASPKPAKKREGASPKRGRSPAAKSKD